jgi:uncharacterized protein YuzE
LNETQLFYFEEEDILHLVIADGEESKSVDLYPNITAELNGDGELIGIEILKAREFLCDSLLGTAQAKLLGLTSPEQ